MPCTHPVWIHAPAIMPSRSIDDPDTCNSLMPLATMHDNAEDSTSMHLYCLLANNTAACSFRFKHFAMIDYHLRSFEFLFFIFLTYSECRPHNSYNSSFRSYQQKSPNSCIFSPMVRPICSRWQGPGYLEGQLAKVCTSTKAMGWNNERYMSYVNFLTAPTFRIRQSGQTLPQREWMLRQAPHQPHPSVMAAISWRFLWEAKFMKPRIIIWLR